MTKDCTKGQKNEEKPCFLITVLTNDFLSSENISRVYDKEFYEGN